MNIYVGLDIGGTKLMAMSVDVNGKEIKKVKYDTPYDLDECLCQLNNMIKEVSGAHVVKGIGAAIGGPLNSVTGVVSPLHQQTWRDVPLKKIMEDKWLCPFYVDVDTNVAAVGEYHLGGYDQKSFLYVTVSTGMGGGFLINGKVYEGLSHPEIAHQSINYKCSNVDRISCECGVKDCLEAIVSGNGIRRIYQKPAEELNSNEWDELAYNLGQGLRNITAILSPEIIVLGGGVVVGGGQKFIDKVENTMCSHLKLVPPPKLRLSCHGYDTALIGSCYFAQGKHLPLV